MSMFYIRESALGVHSLTADNVLAAARFAPVASGGELYRLGEHGLLSGSSAHVRATGRMFVGPFGHGPWVLTLGPDAARAPPPTAEWRSIRPILVRF